MAAKTNILDPNGIITAVDAGTLDPKSSAYGRQDAAKRDKLTVTGNDAAVAGTAAVNRTIVQDADNDDDTVIHVHHKFTAKKGGIMIPKMATADRPAAHANLDGLLYLDTTTSKVTCCIGGAYVQLH